MSVSIGECTTLVPPVCKNIVHNNMRDFGFGAIRVTATPKVRLFVLEAHSNSNHHSILVFNIHLEHLKSLLPAGGTEFPQNSAEAGAKRDFSARLEFLFTRGFSPKQKPRFRKAHKSIVLHLRCIEQQHPPLLVLTLNA